MDIKISVEIVIHAEYSDNYRFSRSRHSLLANIAFPKWEI